MTQFMSSFPIPAYITGCNSPGDARSDPVTLPHLGSEAGVRGFKTGALTLWRVGPGHRSPGSAAPLSPRWRLWNPTLTYGPGTGEQVALSLVHGREARWDKSMFLPSRPWPRGKVRVVSMGKCGGPAAQLLCAEGPHVGVSAHR